MWRRGAPQSNSLIHIAIATARLSNTMKIPFAYPSAWQCNKICIFYLSAGHHNKNTLYFSIAWLGGGIKIKFFFTRFGSAIKIFISFTRLGSAIKIFISLTRLGSAIKIFTSFTWLGIKSLLLYIFVHTRNNISNNSINTIRRVLNIVNYIWNCNGLPPNQSFQSGATLGWLSDLDSRLQLILCHWAESLHAPWI